MWCIALFKNSWQQDLLPVLKISVWTFVMNKCLYNCWTSVKIIHVNSCLFLRMIWLILCPCWPCYFFLFFYNQSYKNWMPEWSITFSYMHVTATCVFSYSCYMSKQHFHWLIDWLSLILSNKCLYMWFKRIWLKTHFLIWKKNQLRLFIKILKLLWPTLFWCNSQN